MIPALRGLWEKSQSKKNTDSLIMFNVCSDLHLLKTQSLKLLSNTNTYLLNADKYIKEERIDQKALG